MIVLVCGGRTYNDAKTLNGILDFKKSDSHGLTKLVCGGARGADSLAIAWARRNNVPTAIYRAQWRDRDGVYNPNAGPERNQRMLDSEKIDYVIAFPGRNGTADMVRRARKKGLLVYTID